MEHFSITLTFFQSSKFLHEFGSRADVYTLPAWQSLISNQIGLHNQIQTILQLFLSTIIWYHTCTSSERKINTKSVTLFAFLPGKHASTFHHISHAFFSQLFSCQDALEKADLVLVRSHLHVFKVLYWKVK